MSLAFLLPAQLRKQVELQIGGIARQGYTAVHKVLAFTACLPLCAADPQRQHVEEALWTYRRCVLNLRKVAARYTASMVGNVWAGMHQQCGGTCAANGTVRAL